MLNAKKSILRNRLKKTAVGATITGALVGLIGVSVEKSQIANISRMKTRTAKITQASTSKYKNRYPRVSEKQFAREMNQVKKIIKLNTKNPVDARIYTNVLGVARGAGVSPRVALRTIARTSTSSKSFNYEITKLKKELVIAEEMNRVEQARFINSELQRVEKIQSIVKEVESLSPSMRTELVNRVKKY